MEEFFGKRYVMTTTESFEDYLIYLGKGYIARKAALTMHPEQTLMKNVDGSYTLTFKSMLVSTTTTFNTNEEFHEVKPDGVTVKTIITIEDNKMIQTQKDDKGRITKHVWEFFPNKMIITTTAEDLNKIVRHFVVIEE